MLEKIKGYILWIVLPLTGLFAFIYKLLTDNKCLKDTVARNEVESKLGLIKGEILNAKNKADASEADYDKLRAEYESGKSSGLPDKPE